MLKSQTAVAESPTKKTRAQPMPRIASRFITPPISSTDSAPLHRYPVYHPQKNAGKGKDSSPPVGRRPFALNIPFLQNRIGAENDKQHNDFLTQIHTDWIRTTPKEHFSHNDVNL
jgi:hypothetical protein